MSETIEPPSTTPEPPRRRVRSSLRAILLVAAGASVATLIVLLYLLYTSSQTFDVVGTFTKHESSWMTLGPCSSNSGKTVVVYNGRGDVLGTGTLGEPTSTWGYRCQYPFTIPDVAGNERVYLFQIDGEQKTSFSRSDAERPELRSWYY